MITRPDGQTPDELKDAGSPDRDPFYIIAPQPLADETTRVLKQGETFAVLDSHGDIVTRGKGEQGIYHEGTRFVSRLELRLNGVRPLLLGSTVHLDNVILAVDLTNPDLFTPDGVLIPRGTLHLFRSKFLWQGRCFERIEIVSYAPDPVEASLTIEVDADFADVFEVRGARRERRGTKLETVLTERGPVLGYEGLDGVVRRTTLEASPTPSTRTSTSVRFEFRLARQEPSIVNLTIACAPSGEIPSRIRIRRAWVDASRSLEKERGERCEIYASSQPFNDWINRSQNDLLMMITETPEGPYPYAGVPWFSTPFGRDGIVTALEVLWCDPSLARGVLGFLAATQAEEVDDEKDAEPGKILHEMRRGEMAALGEIPFGRYYGSIDATPLFIVLAGAYYERTADLDLIRRIWPNIERALSWIDRFGDKDGDGFIEYASRTHRGLSNQGWKDSRDSVFHSDGRIAEGPIALCEVQGYVYAAYRAAALLAEAIQLPGPRKDLLRRADALKERFMREFWMDEIGSYALALDGEKRPCAVRASNAGHTLFSSIAEEAHASRIAAQLLSPQFNSGWGIRTVASREIRYNPMSYHNGSVWPHDNALIAAGLSRHGHTDGAMTILRELFDASLFLDLHRLPELICGFERRPGEGPTLYPAACSPQAWSAGAAFLLIQSSLGLTVDGLKREIRFRKSTLPDFLDTLRIKDLKVGDATVDLMLERHRYVVGVDVLHRSGDVKIISTK